MKTRKFRNRDAAEVSMIMTAAFSSFLKEKFNEKDRKHFSPGVLRKTSNFKGYASGTVSYVAEEKGRIAGYIKGTASENGLGSLEVVGISPEFSGRGVGTLLMKELEKFWKRKKQRKVHTCVSAHNKKALLYYIKNGFIPVGYRKDHFRKGVDEIILDRFL